MHDDLVQVIDKVKTETSLISAKHKTEVHELIYTERSQQLREWAKLEGAQTNHLLRHMAEAERMTSEEADAAVALLGHSTDKLVKTTYGKNLKTLDPLRDEKILRRFADAA